MTRYRNDPQIVTVVALGALAGIRSLLPQAIISRALQRRTLNLPAPFAELASEPVARALSGAALMELAGDKMPGMPHRVSAVPLLGRIASGALAGFVTGKEWRRNALLFAGIGAGAAALSTLATYRLRMFVISRLGVSSTLSGLIEDGLALVAANAVMKRLTP